MKKKHKRSNGSNGKPLPPPPAKIMAEINGLIEETIRRIKCRNEQIQNLKRDVSTLQTFNSKLIEDVKAKEQMISALNERNSKMKNMALDILNKKIDADGKLLFWRTLAVLLLISNIVCSVFALVDMLIK
ncbi:MAG: hypothetical protein IJV91_07145 [Kiritimatiellae bacterium]|nr:hypothetical protein [Kiritimatiellia bacterium]